YLEQFELSSIHYLNQLDAVFTHFDDRLSKIERRIEKETLTLDNLSETLKSIEQKPEELDAGQDRMEALYKNRLFVEFRRNIQLFNNDLEKLNINSLIRRKRRGRKFYGKLREKNAEFARAWHEKLLLIANKHFLDISMLSFKDR